MVEAADTFIASLGVEAYRVGGSVRDEVIERRVKDADYMVRKETLDSLFQRLMAKKHLLRDPAVTPLKLRDGRQAGWRVSGKGIGAVEITLPRKEVSTGPGHRDFEIVLDPDLTVAEDAVRRDFTFNALYKVIYHPDGMSSLVAGPNGVVYENIIDPLGGLEAIQRRKVDITHPDSFRDDPLRTLRALRFVSTLGYDLGRDTRVSMFLHSEHVTGLTSNGYASGTILNEMSKMLMGRDVAKALRLARDTGVLGTLFPELKPMFGHDAGSRYHDLNTDEHTFKALETAAHVDAPLRVRWALLFHDSGKPSVEWRGADGRKHYYATRIPTALGSVITVDHEVRSEELWRDAAKFMHAPVRLREDVATLIREHMVSTQGKLKASKIRRERVRLGDDMLRDLYLHRACDASGKVKGTTNTLERIARMECIRAEAAERGVPSKVGDLAINGDDCMAEGLTGRDIGTALRAVLLEVASQPNETTLSREWQLERLR